MDTLRLTQPLLIRHVRPDEAVALHTACFPDQSLDWVEDYLAWCLAAPGRPARLIAILGSRIVAHVEITPRQNGAWAELSSLVVAEQERRHGIGRRVVSGAVRLARRWGCQEIRLQVDVRKEALISMYRRWGFRLTGLPIAGRRWLLLPIPESQPHPADNQPSTVVF
ncbi:MAG: GNAT family N-acetyltransferase [Ardenticatenales bacterium]|nr:GNAT family N-acetyltransferase [Ardenticatenales bacterium]